MPVEPEWKKLPRLDVELVEFLRKKYPPIEFKNQSKEEFLKQAIMQAGAAEVIASIDRIIELQNKKG
tara:strand:- start:399 stop:599 length:201 start_codon:yes stop_codon:yes gene_type:complete